MKNIKNFKQFNESIFSDIKDTALNDIKSIPSSIKNVGKEFKGIVKTDNDESIRNLFEEIKKNFDPTKISGSKYSLIYDHNGTKIEIKYNPPTFEPFGEFNLNIDSEKNVDCSYLLKKTIYNFFANEWKEINAYLVSYLKNKNK